MLIIIEETPLSKNKYVNAHWNTRRLYKERISWLIYTEKMFEQSIKPDIYAELPYAKAKITIDIFFKTKHRHDVQNYLGGGLIVFFDVLVDLGYIADDSEEVIGQPIVNCNYDKDFVRTEIRIERRD